jgi:hypothetical protein
MPLLTIMVAVLTFLVTTYKDRAEALIKEDAARVVAVREEATATKQAQWAFMAPIRQRQQDLYFEASSAAATIASAIDPQSRAKAEETFWRLYYGPMVFVENMEVSAEMKNFGACLRRLEACTNDERQKLSLKLASAMELARRKTWDMTPEEYMKDQVVY